MMENTDFSDAKHLIEFLGKIKAISLIRQREASYWYTLIKYTEKIGMCRCFLGSFKFLKHRKMYHPGW